MYRISSPLPLRKNRVGQPVSQLGQEGPLAPMNGLGSLPSQAGERLLGSRCCLKSVWFFAFDRADGLGRDMGLVWELTSVGLPLFGCYDFVGTVTQK